jgi:hypothetical protein
MSELIELADLLPVPLDLESKNLQSTVNSSYEFRQYPIEAKESIPKAGKFFHHQINIERYMEIADRLYIPHRAGTGKTRVLIAVAERLRNIKNDRLSTIDGIVVITRTKLINRFKEELKATVPEYNTKTGKKTMNEWYKFLTYIEFQNEASNSKDGKVSDIKSLDKHLQMLYKNKLIIVDEVHNITGILRDITNSKKVLNQKETQYILLHYIFHHVIPIKVMLASATPMVSNKEEIIYILNLILPTLNQLAYNDPFKLEEVGHLISPYVSYLREMDTGTDLVYKGKNLATINKQYDKTNSESKGDMLDETYESQLYIYFVKMLSIQDEAYIKLLDDGKLKAANFFQKEIQVSNFVYPDGSFGIGKNVTREVTVDGKVKKITIPEESTAFYRYIRVDGNTYNPRGKLIDYLKNLRTLSNLSSKYATVIELLRKNDVGTTLIYDNSTDASGISIFAMCLSNLEDEKMDFFNENTSTFIGNQIKSTFLKKSRYALITSKTPDNVLTSLIEILNSPFNKNGEYIKTILLSSAGREGLSINHATQFFLLGSDWSPSAIYQAMSRINRATSHIYLLEDLKEKYRIEGKDPNDARIKIDIYNMASIPSSGQSIDLTMYVRTEQKSYIFAKRMRVLKQSAFDCILNRKRNILPKDKDYSSICDYDLCDYKCISTITPTQMNYTNYDALYLNEDVKLAGVKIIELFGTKFNSTLEELRSLLPQVRPQAVSMAIDFLVKNRISVINRLGITSYFFNYKNIVFIQSIFSNDSVIDYSSMYYSRFTFGKLETPLKTILQTIQSPKRTEFINKVWTLDVKSAEFKIAIEALDLESKKLLIEESIIKKIENKSNEISRKLLDVYNYFIFQTRIPTSSLEDTNLKWNKKGKGRKRIDDKARTIESWAVKLANNENMYIEEQDTPIVYIHTLNSMEIRNTRSGEIRRLLKGGDSYGEERIYIPDENVGWRNVTELESYVYNFYIQKQNHEKIQNYSNASIYGTVSPSGLFRIADQRETKRGNDARKFISGEACSQSSKKDHMIDRLWEITKGEGFVFTQNIDKSVMIYSILGMNITKNISITLKDVESWSYSRIAFYYYYKTIKESTNNICKKIEAALNSKNLLFYFTKW